MDVATTATEEMQERWAEFLEAMSFRMLPGNMAVLETLRPMAWDGDVVTLGTPQAEDAEELEEALLPRLRHQTDQFFPGVTFRVRALNGHGATAGSGGVGKEEVGNWGAGERGAGKLGARGGEEEDDEGEGGGEEEADEGVEIEAVTDPALARFDVSLAGWSKLANYATDFWSELLGPAAFLTWTTIRHYDMRRTKTEWTPAMHFSVSYLARKAAAGDRRAITGVWRTCRAASMVEGGEPCPQCQDRGGQRQAPHTCRYWKPGALDRLQAEGVAAVERHWEGLHVTYRLRVFALLPLLTPAQVADLHPTTQQEHSRWLLRQDLDAAAWERLTVRYLAL